ncbi:TPA: polymer-forming cytoskeletal protein, partial [Streptococcus suis]
NNAMVYGDAIVCGNAMVKSISDYIVFKNSWSSGRYFTWTKSNNKWKDGFFYGTGEELIEKACQESELSGRMYEAYVNHVKNLMKIMENVEQEQ